MRIAITTAVLASLIAVLSAAVYALHGGISGIDAVCIVGPVVGFVVYLMRGRRRGFTIVGEAMVVGFMAALPVAALIWATLNISDHLALALAPFGIGYGATLGAWIGARSFQDGSKSNKALQATRETRTPES